MSCGEDNAGATLPWLPETFDLDLPADCDAALEAEDGVVAEKGKGATWIYKPASSNRGRGITVRLAFRSIYKIIGLHLYSFSFFAEEKNSRNCVILRKRGV